MRPFILLGDSQAIINMKGGQKSERKLLNMTNVLILGASGSLECIFCRDSKLSSWAITCSQLFK